MVRLSVDSCEFIPNPAPIAPGRGIGGGKTLDAPFSRHSTLLRVFVRQPTYHSAFDEDEGPVVAGCKVLPLRAGPRGPAPVVRADAEAGPDIVDEAVDYFRANVLFRSFEVKGPADRVLVYLTLFIQQCLVTANRAKSKDEAARQLRELAISRFAVPGDPGFVIPPMFPVPSADEKDQLSAYFRQLREATAARLVERIFWPDGTPNKFWMAFHKKKFMNLEMKA